MIRGFQSRVEIEQRTLNIYGRSTAAMESLFIKFMRIFFEIVGGTGSRLTAATVGLPISQASKRRRVSKSVGAAVAKNMTKEHKLNDLSQYHIIYLTFKLIDFVTRNASSSGGRKVIGRLRKLRPHSDENCASCL